VVRTVAGDDPKMYAHFFVKILVVFALILSFFLTYTLSFCSFYGASKNFQCSSGDEE